MRQIQTHVGYQPGNAMELPEADRRTGIDPNLITAILDVMNFSSVG